MPREKFEIRTRKNGHEWRDDTQHNDIQHNDIQHNDIQHNDIQHNDIQHNDTEHNGLICDTQHNDIQPNLLSNVMLRVVYAECGCTDCHDAECRGAT